MGSLLNLVTTVVVATLAFLASCLYLKIHHQRYGPQNKLPQHPTSFLWGHLRVLDEYTKRGNPERHPDAVMMDMYKDIGRPSLMALDVWPIRSRMVVITSHDLAEQLTKPSKEFPYGATKAPSIDRIMPLVGPRSILRLHNEEWKNVRRRFNPGFARGHLMSLLPCIMDKMKPFLARLDHMAALQMEFPFQQLMRDLTFDIMGAVLMDHDLKAQHIDESQQGPMVRLYKQLLASFANDRLHLPWWLVPLTEVRRRRLGAQIDHQLKELVREKFQEIVSSEDRNENGTRTVLALGLQDAKVLTPQLLSETVDQLKTFLFAGHDTSSTLLSWTMYELSRTPRVLQAVRDELEKIFGPETCRDPQAIRDKLMAPSGGDLVYKMPYISAVIKEVLRLYPPAGTLRIAQPGEQNWVNTSEGESFCLDGNWIYINHTIIQRSTAVYGETAEDFIPERWLGDKSSGLATEISVSGWRAFERGPRNCIGQELAMIKARVIIAMLAHRYTFIKVGLGELKRDEKGEPVLNGNGQYDVKSDMYNVIELTAKPAQEMMMKVVALPNSAVKAGKA